MNPALLIADEPTGNLDSKTSQTVLNILADIAHDSESTRAVVMATHDLEAARNTDRVISMLDGRIDTDVLSGSGLRSKPLSADSEFSGFEICARTGFDRSSLRPSSPSPQVCSSQCSEHTVRSLDRSSGSPPPLPVTKRPFPRSAATP